MNLKNIPTKTLEKELDIRKKGEPLLKSIEKKFKPFLKRHKVLSKGKTYIDPLMNGKIEIKVTWGWEESDIPTCYSSDLIVKDSSIKEFIKLINLDTSYDLIEEIIYDLPSYKQHQKEINNFIKDVSKFEKANKLEDEYCWETFLW